MLVLQQLSDHRQVAAARALARLSQAELAAAAGVSVTTVRAIEASQAQFERAAASTLRKLQSALEAAGVHFHEIPAADAGGTGPALAGVAVVGSGRRRRTRRKAP